MTEDGKDVQPAGASTDGANAPETKQEATQAPPESTPDKSQTQPLTPDAIAKMIEDKLAPIQEDAKRQIQRVKDKAGAEVEKANRRVADAENRLNQVRGKLKESNPDLATELENSDLKSRVEHYENQDKEDQVRQQMAQFDQTFKSNINQFITDMGIEPTDKRIDWGDDAPNYLEKQNRVMASLAKIHKTEAKKYQDSVAQQIKDAEARLRKELGLDSVDTSNSTAGRIPDDKKSASDWIKEGLQEKQRKK